MGSNPTGPTTFICGVCLTGGRLPLKQQARVRLLPPQPRRIVGVVKIKAPFTADQIRKLNAWQQKPYVHPFTCGNDSRHGVLVAAADGWHCPDCDYAQPWAHDFMAQSTSRAY